MKRLIIIMVGILILITGCEKEEGVKYSGIAVFTSEPRGEYFTSGYGFSFEDGKNIICSDLNCTQADIVAIHLILQTEIEEVFLQSPINQDAFSFLGSFGTEAEAIAFYDDYNEVTTTDFVFTTGDLQANQVWAVQTIDMKYAKFRVIEIIIYAEASYPYAEVKVEYEFQPGGTKLFSR
jgi:hypothetical protein